MSLKYLLDTNIISEVMRPTPNSQVLERLEFNQAIENWFHEDE